MVKYTAPKPYASIRKPVNAGASSRIPLVPTLPRDTALSNCSPPTISGRTDWRDGIISPMTVPWTTEATARTHQEPPWSAFR